jgi:hypothetical protein
MARSVGVKLVRTMAGRTEADQAGRRLSLNVAGRGGSNTGAYRGVAPTLRFVTTVSGYLRLSRMQPGLSSSYHWPSG